MATIFLKVTKVNRNYNYCKRNIDILGCLQPSFRKFNHLRNGWTITHGCLSRTYTSSQVYLSLERSANFQKASFIKERSYHCCLRRAILQEGGNICYKMQELLRKVWIYIQNVYYAGNSFISRNNITVQSRPGEVIKHSLMILYQNTFFKNLWKKHQKFWRILYASVQTWTTLGGLLLLYIQGYCFHRFVG